MASLTKSVTWLFWRRLSTASFWLWSSKTVTGNFDFSSLSKNLCDFWHFFDFFYIFYSNQFQNHTWKFSDCSKILVFFSTSPKYFHDFDNDFLTFNFFTRDSRLSTFWFSLISAWPATLEFWLCPTEMTDFESSWFSFSLYEKIFSLMFSTPFLWKKLQVYVFNSIFRAKEHRCLRSVPISIRSDLFIRSTIRSDTILKVFVLKDRKIFCTIFLPGISINFWEIRYNDLVEFKKFPYHSIFIGFEKKSDIFEFARFFLYLRSFDTTMVVSKDR